MKWIGFILCMVVSSASAQTKVCIDTAVARYFLGLHYQVESQKEQLMNAKLRENELNSIIVKQDTIIQLHKRDSELKDMNAGFMRKKHQLSLDSANLRYESVKKENNNLKIGLVAATLILILSLLGG